MGKDAEIYFSIDRDELTGGLQLSINNGDGGFRICGPKYCGESTTLKKYVLIKSDADEIKTYLRRVR